MTRKLRVVVVDPAAYSLAYDAPLAGALAQAGCEVELITTAAAHTELPDMPAGVTVTTSFYRWRWAAAIGGRQMRRMLRGVQHPFNMLRLRRRLLRERPDVVHVQWLLLDRFDTRIYDSLRRAGIRTVFTAHNAQERDEQVSTDILDAFDMVIAHTEGGAATLRNAGVRGVRQIAIGAFDAYASMANPEPLPVDLAPDAPVAVMAGLLRPYKGVDVLLKAWPQVRAALPSAQLVIAGRPMGVELPDAAPANATVTDGLHVLPRFLTEHEYGWLLRRATVCCLPYLKIDMSGVAASALACSTPIVASRVGGFTELEGRGALLCAPGDASALAEQLIRVLGDPDLQSGLQQLAREAVRDHYSWDAIAAQTVAGYRAE